MKKIVILLLLLPIAIPLAGATIKREVEASPGETLEVNLRGGDVEIVGWDRNVVSVDATVSGRDSDETTIEVRRTAKGVVIEQGRGGRASRSRVDLRIQVPRRFDLELATMGGDLAVENVHGTLSGRTHGGRLRLARLGGSVAMSTHGGNVTLRDSVVDGTVRTMGGEVLFENVSGGVQGTSMGGNVVYRNVTGSDGRATGKAVHITTMGGDVTVADAPDGAELSTMGGEVRVTSARRFVRAKTMGGSIRIDAVDGWVEATTMGGNVHVTMTGDPARGDRHVTIESKGGDIDLAVPAGLEMDLDIEIAFTKNSRRQYEIRSEFPLEVTTTPQWSYREGDARRTIRGRGKTGSARNKVTIRTINGDVRLRNGR